MSERIFAGQPYQLRIETDTSLTPAIVTQIRIKRPDTDTAYFVTATVDPLDDSVLEYDMSGANNSVAGVWQFNAYVTFGGGDTPTPGTNAFIRVYPLS